MVNVLEMQVSNGYVEPLYWGIALASSHFQQIEIKSLQVDSKMEIERRSLEKRKI